MKKIFKNLSKKLAPNLFLFSILIQNIFPLSSLFISPAYASTHIDSDKVSIDFNENNHQLEIDIADDLEINYLVEYQDLEEDVTQAIQGKTEAMGGVSHADVYMGTCSADDCLPDEFDSGKVVFVGTDYQIDFSYTSGQLWITKDGLSSISSVERGVSYRAPQNNEVVVTFTKLPENPGSLSIQEIYLTDEQVEELGAASNVAYDITSNMEDGTFKYDLTLPIPEGADGNPQIVYAEDLSDLSNVSEVEEIVVGDDISVVGLNHFTVFVVTTNPIDCSGGIYLAGSCYATLQEAINNASSGDTIELASNLSVSQEVDVSVSSITIDGKGFTLTSPFIKTGNDNNSAIGIHTDNVTIKNLIVDGAGGTDLHGINIYVAANILLDNVTAKNYRSGVVVNGSIVTVNNITTSGNSWHGINVDLGTNVTTPATLTVNGYSSHDETLHIYSDHYSSKPVSVVDAMSQYSFYDGVKNLDDRVYMLQDIIGPEAPAILSPTEDQNFISTPILNDWTDVSDPSGIDHYRIQYEYDDGHTFSGYPYRETTVSQRNHTPGNSEQGGVKIRVQAFDGVGNEGAWSEWRHYYYDETAPGTPIQTGYNENNGDSYSVPRPINELACTGDATNINGVSVHWTDTSGSSSVIKYQRQYRVGSGSWSGNEIYTQPYTNYRVFGGGLGNEGTYGSRVRSWKDYDNDSVVDSNEMVSNWSNECAVTFDRTAPSQPVIIAPVNGLQTNVNAITVLWTGGNDQGSTQSRTESYVLRYEFTPLGGGSAISWSSGMRAGNPQSHSGSYGHGQGTYEIYVKTIDQAGNESLESSPLTVTYDATAPATPTGIEILDSSGNSIGCGGFVNKRLISVDWNDSPEIDFDHYLYDIKDKENFRALTASKVSGNIRDIDDLYKYRVKAVDKAGNISDPSPWCEVTLDRVAPELTIDSIKYPNGTTNILFVTNYNTPVILGSLVSDDVVSVVLSVDGYDYSAVLGAGWESSITNVLSDGEHTMIVTATDKAGNDKSFEQKIFIDTVAPTADHTYYRDSSVITDPIAYGQVLGQFSFTGEYVDQDPSAGLYEDSFVIFQAQDDGSFRFSANGKKAYCGWRKSPNLVSLGGGSTFSLVAAVNFTECTASLPDGEYYMAHHLYDSATRKDIPSIHQFRDALGLHFMIDTVDPTSAITSYDLENGGQVETATFSGLIEGTATDGSGSGIDHVLLSIEHYSFEDGPTGTKYWDDDSSAWVVGGVLFKASGAENWDYQLSSVPEGVYTITSHAVDKAGNQESTFVIRIVFDKTIPEVILTIDPVTPDADNGWYKTLPTITLAATDNYLLDKIEYKWNSESWTTYTTPINPPGEGQNILYYRGIDKVGNTTEIGVKEVKYDVTKPEEGPLNVKVSNITLDSAIGKWEAPDDASDITRYVLSWRHESGDSNGKEVGSDVFEHKMENLYDGEWTLIVKAMDDAGNFRESSTKFTIGAVATTTTTTTEEGTILGVAAGIGGTNPVVTGQVAGDSDEKTEDKKDNSGEGGQVLGTEDEQCDSMSSNLPWIMLAAQFMLMILAEFLLRRGGDKTKNIALWVIALSMPGIFYLLRNQSCYSPFIYNLFVLPSLAVTLFIRLIRYLFIEDVN